MKNLKWPVAILIGSTVCAHASEAQDRRIAEVINNPTLVGKTVNVRSCVGVPMRADTDTSEAFVVLYPCDHAGDKSPPEMILGKIESDDVAQPFIDAKVSFDKPVEATFIGRLAKRHVEQGNPKKYLVLTIETVRNPIQKPEPQCLSDHAPSPSCDQ